MLPIIISDILQLNCSHFFDISEGVALIASSSCCIPSLKCMLVDKGCITLKLRSNVLVLLGNNPVVPSLLL